MDIALDSPPGHPPEASIGGPTFAIEEPAAVLLATVLNVTGCQGCFDSSAGVYVNTCD